MNSISHTDMYNDEYEYYQYADTQEERLRLAGEMQEERDAIRAEGDDA